MNAWKKFESLKESRAIEENLVDSIGHGWIKWKN